MSAKVCQIRSFPGRCLPSLMAEVCQGARRSLLCSPGPGGVGAVGSPPERSMYRELSRLWDKLGVSGRAAGLQKATAEGLID